MVAQFNLGTGPGDYTVPDGGVLVALLVLEALSPDDAT